MPGGDYTLVTDTGNYLEETRHITLPLAGEPVITLTLVPSPVYPFPAGTTLIRGVARDEDDGNPVNDANVLVVGKGIETRTTGKGEFVLYFKGLTQDDITESGGKTYVKGNGNNRVRVRVIHPDYHNKTVQTEVEEGKTASMILELKRKGG
jgi:hypothetical protein